VVKAIPHGWPWDIKMVATAEEWDCYNDLNRSRRDIDEIGVTVLQHLPGRLDEAHF